jgi:hypothetical protein
MASAETCIKRIALQVANHDIAGLPALEAERRKAAAQLADIDSRIVAARDALNRARSFAPAHGRDLLCPMCWVRHNEKAFLRAVPSPDTHDIYECARCGDRIDVPVLVQSHRT